MMCVLFAVYSMWASVMWSKLCTHTTGTTNDTNGTSKLLPLPAPLVGSKNPWQLPGYLLPLSWNLPIFNEWFSKQTFHSNKGKEHLSINTKTGGIFENKNMFLRHIYVTNRSASFTSEKSKWQSSEEVPPSVPSFLGLVVPAFWPSSSSIECILWSIVMGPSLPPASSGPFKGSPNKRWVESRDPTHLFAACPP